MISRRQFLRFIGGLGALGASTAAYGFGEPLLRLRVARYEITPPQWPADFQLRIAVIADLHACDPWMSLDRIEGIVERTNALDADVIVMLGDYVAGHRQVTRYIPANEWAPVLAGLKAPLGVHAILGNHDWWEDKTVQREGQGPTIARRALEAAGIPVYENDARRLTKDGRPFWLAGLGDQLAYRSGAPLPAGAAHRRRRSRRDAGESHRRRAGDPAGARARHRDARAGAGRAAALRPYPWRPGAPARLVAGGAVADQKLAYGHIRMNCDIVVSGGLGCSIMPFRIGVPPEIVLVTLGGTAVARGVYSRSSAMPRCLERACYAMLDCPRAERQ